MIEIPVELGPRSYPIVIGHGLAAALPEILGRLRGRRFVVVSAPRIWWGRKTNFVSSPFSCRYIIT